MIFYLVLLAITIGLTIILSTIIVKMVQKIRRNDIRHPGSYFVPTILTVVLCCLCFLALFPLVFDAPLLMDGHRELNQVVFDREVFPGVLLSQEGERYYFDPFGEDVEFNVPYMVGHGKNSNFIVDMTPLDAQGPDAENS